MDLFAPRRDGPVVHRYPGPSTLGTFLRLFSLDHVRQLNALAARFLARLGGSLPGWGVPCPVGRFLARLAGSILARADQMRSSISITPCGRAMAMPSRRRARLYQRQGLQYAARYDLHTAVGAADRHRPACAKQRPTRCAARRAYSPTRWRPRAAPRRAAADRARRLGYYIANGRRHAIDVDVTFKKPRATAY
jgi:hypothetical protein